MRMPKKLNMEWEKAIVTASTWLVTKEARIAVTVVPIFVPNVKGYTCSRVSSPEPIRGIANEVVTELLWTMAVVITPSEKLDKSFLKR